MIDFLAFIVRVVWSMILLAIILLLSPLVFIVVAVSDVWRYVHDMLQR